jgi:hypothetical protein
MPDKSSRIGCLLGLTLLCGLLAGLPMIGLLFMNKPIVELGEINLDDVQDHAKVPDGAYVSFKAKPKLETIRELEAVIEANAEKGRGKKRELLFTVEESPRLVIWTKPNQKMSQVVRAYAFANEPKERNKAMNDLYKPWVFTGRLHDGNSDIDDLPGSLVEKYVKEEMKDSDVKEVRVLELGANPKDARLTNTIGWGAAFVFWTIAGVLWLIGLWKILRGPGQTVQKNQRES